MTIPSIYLLVALAGGTTAGAIQRPTIYADCFNYFLNRLVWSGAGH